MDLLVSLVIVFIFPACLVFSVCKFIAIASNTTTKLSELKIRVSTVVVIISAVVSSILYILTATASPVITYYLCDYSNHINNEQIAKAYSDINYNDYDIVTVTQKKILGLPSGIQSYTISSNTELVEELGLLVYTATDTDEYFKFNDQLIPKSVLAKYISSIDLEKPVKLKLVKAVDDPSRFIVKNIEQTHKTE